MSADKNAAGGKGGGQTELMLVGLLLTCALFSKVWPFVQDLWINHRLTIILSIWLLGISGVVYLSIKLWNEYVKRCHEDAITESDESAVYLGRKIE